LAKLGFELRATPARQNTTTWATPPALFVLGIFLDSVLFYVWAGLDCDSPIYVSFA
jgi:hypothetical protein